MIQVEDIYDAAKDGDDLKLQSVLDKCQDINAIKDWFGSALHRAAYDGNLQAVKSLIQKGADVNDVTDRGTTPLHLASSIEYVNYL